MEAGTLGNTRTAQNGRSYANLRRYTTEAKASFKTSEFWLTIAVIVGVLVSAAAIKGGDTLGTDEFIARQAWLYVEIMTGVNAIFQNSAKSGSHEPYGVEEPGQDVPDNA